MKYVPMLFAGIIFVTGLSIVAYPLVGQCWNEQHQSEVCAVYEEQLANTDENTINEELQAAQAYNQALAQTVWAVSDPFAQPDNREASAYDDLLNAADDGMMAYLEIPELDIDLPIYHGVDADVLKKGIGHLPETSLPVGGASTHAVLCGHSGMSYAKLFTDLDRMKKGDVFYIHVQQEKLTYQVDQIKTVLPTDISDLEIVTGEDYVTLMTCTPYGVNSHRLLVRGTRLSQKQAEEKQLTVRYEETRQNEQPVSTWEREYVKYVAVAGALAAALLLAVIVFVRRR